MCEWLACREWCDVQLLCGGRAFSAHRAVLASASAFLRQILLSCPTEETSTFIVLPEFDIEAMSSVLYYIYNGEVVIQKQKLGMFLDIVKAMQIFVDSQYLARSDIEHADFNKCLDRVCIQSGASALFCLESETRNGNNYVNIKKGEALQDILRRCSFSDGILDWLKPREGLESDDKSAFEVFSQFGDRQRSATLRELFIETYPEYGNANGRSAGVLEITNGRYRGPTSVLLTNANGSHPGAGCARGAPTTSHSSNGPPDMKNECHAMTYGNSNIEKTMKQRSTKTILERCRSVESNGMTNLNPFPFAPYLDLRMAALLDADTDLVLKQNGNMPLLSSTNYKSSVKHKDTLSTKHKGKKNTILNHVLESPWCPRIPKSYLFCKNVKRNPDVCENTDMPMEEKPDNDRNNNISLVSKAAEKDSLSVKQDTTSSNFEDYSCNVCEQVYPSAEALSTHARRHTTPSRYSCTECSKTFSQLRNFKYHMSVHRGTREFAATCPVCGKYFNDRGYLSSHMKIHRNRKEYKCSLCPKSFNQRVAYNMHVRIHTGVKPHVCAECGKAFSRKMLLKQHQRTHSGERPYGCAHCGKRFADRSNMTLHLRLHSGVKPFSCSLCPKSFTKKHHLKSHLNFHTGVKPYSCPRCRLAFTQSSNMRTHLKKCNAPTPHTQLVDNTSIEPVLGKTDPDSAVTTDP